MSIPNLIPSHLISTDHLNFSSPIIPSFIHLISSHLISAPCPLPPPPHCFICVHCSLLCIYYAMFVVVDLPQHLDVEHISLKQCMYEIQHACVLGISSSGASTIELHRTFRIDQSASCLTVLSEPQP